MMILIYALFAAVVHPSACLGSNEIFMSGSSAFFAPEVYVDQVETTEAPAEFSAEAVVFPSRKRGGFILPMAREAQPTDLTEGFDSGLTRAKEGERIEVHIQGLPETTTQREATETTEDYVETDATEAPASTELHSSNEVPRFSDEELKDLILDSEVLSPFIKHRTLQRSKATGSRPTVAVSQKQEPAENPFEAVQQQQQNPLEAVRQQQQQAPEGNSFLPTLSTGTSSSANILGSGITQRQGTSIGSSGISTGNQREITAGGVPISSFGESRNIAPLLGASGQNSPFGPFQASIGGGRTKGFEVLGNGYRSGNRWRAGWPHGWTKTDGTDAYALGRRVFSKQDTFGVQPNAITEWDIGSARGVKVLGNGFERGSDCTAGINGYRCMTNRFNVPVLGTNVVEHGNGHGFDLANFRFGKGTVGAYGPVNLETGGTDFDSPWLGKIVQNAIWNKFLQKSGYSGIPRIPDSKSRALPIPRVPLVG